MFERQLYSDFTVLKNWWKLLIVSIKKTFKPDTLKKGSAILKSIWQRILSLGFLNSNLENNIKPYIDV